MLELLQKLPEHFHDDRQELNYLNCDQEAWIHPANLLFQTKKIKLVYVKT